MGLPVSRTARLLFACPHCLREKRRLKVVSLTRDSLAEDSLAVFACDRHGMYNAGSWPKSRLCERPASLVPVREAPRTDNLAALRGPSFLKWVRRYLSI